MKKFLMIILSVLLIMSFAGCSKKVESNNAVNNSKAANNNLEKKEKIEHDDNLEKEAKKFVVMISDGDYDTAFNKFNKDMKKAVSKDKLKKTWETICVQLGEYKKILGIRTEYADDFDKVFVTCEFDKTIFDVKVVFDKEKNIGGLFFVETEKIPETDADKTDDTSEKLFYEEEVTVGTGEWALPGTLTIPKGEGAFPAVVLVHGSGANDRDETIGPNKPFKDLAHGLAAKGIAVLRYDKRTLVHGKKIMEQKKGINVQTETIDDALLAVDLLRNRKEIENNRIFVLGHSLGGNLFPRIGQQDSNISGFICMAGSTRPLEDFFIEQYEYIFSLDGEVTNEEKTLLEQVKGDVDKIKALDVNNYDADEVLLNVPAEYWVDLKQYNPAEIVKTLKQPILILQGERDYQVTMKDFKLWKDILSDRDNIEFKSYEKLNHLFLEGEGKPNPDEYAIKSHIPQYVIDDIGNWILNN